MIRLHFALEYLGLTMIAGAAAILCGSAISSHLFPILNHVCQVMK